MSKLSEKTGMAWEARAALLASLHKDGTDCYRLFHGTVEGHPGLTVDRYGDVLLVQTFHESLSAEELTEIERFYRGQLPNLGLSVYNDRSLSGSRYENKLADDLQKAARESRVCHELGVKYVSKARHRGQDPLLFLDLRATRRYLQTICKGKTFLNLFSYTCGAGIAAAVSGASHVTNVDFAESSLKYGRQSSELNGLNESEISFIEDDFFAVARQFAGLPLGGRRSKGRPAIQAKKRDEKQFDIVLLDPPRWAKSKFGTVDLIRDYASVFKPSLLTVAPGGKLICANNVASVPENEWLDLLQRSAKKAGRPVHSVEMIRPEADFPSFDDAPPLKVAVLSV